MTAPADGTARPSLLLVRHGQTTSNVIGALDTRLPGAELTELGREQAVGVGAELHASGVAPDRILSSGATRARQTAELMATHWPVPCEVVEGVHEVQAGEYEMRSDADAVLRYGAMLHDWLVSGDRRSGLPGGETADQVRQRVLPVVESLGDGLRSGAIRSDVVLVAHGTLIRLVAAFVSAVPSEWAFVNRIDNCGVVELSPTDTGWRCLRWGSVDGVPGTG